MRSSLAFVVLLLKTCLVTARYIKDGMIFEGAPALDVRDTSAVPDSEIPRPITTLLSSTPDSASKILTSDSDHL
jgi:hypothetical protein